MKLCKDCIHFRPVDDDELGDHAKCARLDAQEVRKNFVTGVAYPNERPYCEIERKYSGTDSKGRPHCGPEAQFFAQPPEPCDCEDCCATDDPCHMDCDPGEECQGCRLARAERSEIEHAIDQAQGRV